MYVGDRTAVNEEEQRRKRAESLASVGELAAGLAHEVNNPLASIKSFAQLLARDAPPGDQHPQRLVDILLNPRLAQTLDVLDPIGRQARFFR